MSDSLILEGRNVHIGMQGSIVICKEGYSVLNMRLGNPGLYREEFIDGVGVGCVLFGTKVCFQTES